MAVTPLEGKEEAKDGAGMEAGGGGDEIGEEDGLGFGGLLVKAGTGSVPTFPDR